MKSMRLLALVMTVIFAMVLAGCAGQGQADTSSGIGSASDTMNSTPGAQQTDMPGTEPGSTGASGAMTDTNNTDTGVTGSDAMTDTSGTDASSGTSGTGGSGTSNTGGTGATGAMTDTTNAGDTSGGLSGSFGNWNYAMLDGFTTGSAGGSDAVASDTITMTGAFEGDSYVIELQRGDAGDATSLDEWVTSEMDALGGSDAMTGTQSTTVGAFNATTLTLPQAAFGDNFAGATCAARTFVWGMGSDDNSGSGSSDDNSGSSSGNSSGSDDNSGSSSNDDSNGNLLIVTVYQTSGDTCNADQVMTQFLSGFQSGDMSGSDSSSDNSGSAGTATGTTTP